MSGFHDENGYPVSREELEAHAQEDRYFHDEDTATETLPGTAELLLAVECLSEKQRFVIELRSGLRGGRVHSQQEIANLMGTGRTAVEGLEARAIEALRVYFR